MQRVDDELLLRILRACAEHSPLYPAPFAKDAGVERGLLDVALDALRSNGLLAFTPWVKGLGQGYQITDAGRQALAQPGRLHERPAADPAPPAGRDPGLEEVIRLFENPLTPYVTWVMLALNVLAFVAGLGFAVLWEVPLRDVISGENTSPAYNVLLRKEGALNTTDVFPPRGSDARPEIERMLLCNFLHIGLIHLMVNMWSLVNLGRQIEAMWGHFRYLVLYLVSGLCSAGFVLWQAEVRLLTAGASGVLFGLFAGMVVWFLMHRQYLSERVTQAWSRNIGINLILLVAVNFMPGVSWGGHLGGAIGGALAALCLSQVRFRKSPLLSTFALLATLLLPVIFYILAYRANY
jgi:rhomboid protease GluP